MRSLRVDLSPADSEVHIDVLSAPAVVAPGDVGTWCGRDEPTAQATSAHTAHIPIGYGIQHALQGVQDGLGGIW